MFLHEPLHIPLTVRAEISIHLSFTHATNFISIYLLRKYLFSILNDVVYCQILGCDSEHKNIFLPSKSFQPIVCVFVNVLDIRATKKNNIWLPPSSCSPKYRNDEEPGSRKRELVHIRSHHSYPNKVRTS